MALVLADRVQENTTTTGTGTLTLDGAVFGFQTFAVVGNGNTCYYTIVDGGAWEVGIGTYSTTGPSLVRTTVLSNSNGNTSPITLAVGTKNVFLTYPAEKSVNVDGGSTVNLPGALVLNGTINSNSNAFVGGNLGGNQFLPSNGSGAQVNSLRDGFVTVNVGTGGTISKTSTFDINGNLLTNSVTQAIEITTASGTLKSLTASSPHFQVLTGTGVQTIRLPDATSLTTGSTWTFDNNSTGGLTVADFAGTTLEVVPPGGYSTVFLQTNATVAGTWGRYGMLPAEVNWGTNSLDLGGSTIVTNGTWQGSAVQPPYGGTGLTTFSAANNALYSTGASTLTAGTLPIAAGGTGNTTASGAINALIPSQTSNAGKYLTTNGTSVSWDYVSTALVPITQNADNVTVNQTIAAGANGFSVGPMTIQSGVTVTVASGQRWVVI
jgi:hypothetical protein